LSLIAAVAHRGQLDQAICLGGTVKAIVIKLLASSVLGFAVVA
jgi:hypothetical protein